MLKTTRTEQHQINKNHPYYKTIDEFCFRSKNLYNAANYIIRQSFIKNGNYINYYDMAKNLKHTTEFKALMSQASQCTLQVLDRNWRSFFQSIKDYQKNPHKYLGRPRIPKYKDKNGRFPWILKNNQTYIKEGRLYFKLKVFNGFSFKTSMTGRLISVRFIPRGSIYALEIVCEEFIEPLSQAESDRICGIDLGVDNFVTMVNNIGTRPIIINGKGIKSINQHYNKSKAKIQSEVKKRNNKNWCNRLGILTLKRNNKVKNFIHHVSKYIVTYCDRHKLNILVIGLNKTWKQELKMNDSVSQNFVFLPYNLLIKQLEYKCEQHGIKLIVTEESYTSGTSVLDNELPFKENYNKGRRIKRGLFQSDSGKLINSDVNGAFQIIRKVFPKEFEYGIQGSLSPKVINVLKI